MKPKEELNAIKEEELKQVVGGLDPSQRRIGICPRCNENAEYYYDKNGELHMMSCDNCGIYYPKTGEWHLFY